MTTLYRFEGFRFFFYPNEANEPPHIHVSKGNGEMKIWLYTLTVEFSVGLKSNDERIALKIAKNNQRRFLKEWNKLYE